MMMELLTALILAAALSGSGRTAVPLFNGTAFLNPRPSAVEAEARSAPQVPQDSHSLGPVSGEKTSPEQKRVTGYHLPPEKYEKAVAYSRAKYRLYFIQSIYGLLVLLSILRWRWAARLRDWAEGRGSRRRIVEAWIFAPSLILMLAIFGLPPDVYGHWLSLKYEQSVQGWGSWTLDWIKEQLVGVIFGTFLIWILYGVIRRSARRWWFYFWLASLPIIVFLVFAQPVVVDPLFFKFQPLPSTQPALASEISKVVQHAGMDIPSSRMFEMKASKKLKSVNAYVTGVGASKRVVVWDTTISRMSIPETLYVFGHEMGHYVLGHIWKGMAFTAAVLFIFLYLGFRVLRWSLDRWGSRWGIRAVEDWASLPVLLLVLSVFMFLGSPGFNSFSRYQEHQADQYGLEVIHGLVPESQQVAARAFQVLGEIDLDDPHPSPFVRFWLYSHPPLDERIGFVLRYDPWEEKKSPQFVK